MIVSKDILEEKLNKAAAITQLKTDTIAWYLEKESDLRDMSYKNGYYDAVVMDIGSPPKAYDDSDYWMGFEDGKGDKAAISDRE